MFFDYGKKLNGIMRVMTGHVLALVVCVAILFVSTRPAHSAIIINAPMTDTNSSGWTLGGTPTSSILTGNGTTDPVGQGWLRLTNNTGNQTGFAYNNTSFDLSQGVLIQFDYATWGGNGADGYSVYLFDANVPTFNIGAFGGSLGYAQKLPPTVPTAVPGISGGYMGIGVDEYGNFASPTEGRSGGPGQRLNTVTIRGSVVGFGGGAIGQTTNTVSYPWVWTSANNGSLWYNGSPRPDQTSPNYRKVVLRITPAPNPTASVWIQFGYNQPLTQMISNQALPAIATAQLLKIGYSASTGGVTNYHEIRNLLVTSLNTSTVIDLGITKTASVTSATVGNPITYTVTARNYGPNNVPATGVGIVDNVPASITGVTWTCAGSGDGICAPPASGSGNAINTTATLPMNGAVTYTINGTVTAPAPAQLSNTASLVIPGSVTDYNPNNDSATVSIPVNSNLSTSTKSVTDINGGSYSAGDVLQYTITLNESSGAAASGVSVTDPIDLNLTYFTVVSFPSGATNSSTTTTLNITGINVPANGSVTIVFNATISGTATPGTPINNTATVTNPSGTGAAPVAPEVTVAFPVGTGNKPLYLYGSNSTPAYKLSRTPTPSSPSAITLAKNGGSQLWSQDPVLQSDVTLSTLLSDNVPVTLYLASNAAANRNVTVSLQCSSGGTPLTLALTGIPLTTTPSPQTFYLPLNAALTCGAGYRWNITVRNNSTGNGPRNVLVYPVYPLAGGNVSRVTLPSQNVINVDSIAFYSAPFPGGSLITSVPPGGTAYIRATVSDPFGSYDINGSNITITDSSGTVRVNLTAMTEIPAAGTAATKIYEYPYTVPPAGPAGNWTVRVVAAEGTENNVTDDTTATMPVVAPPNLTVVKSASPSPSVNPGQEVTYTILVTNTNTGNAANVEVTDSLSPYTYFAVDSYGAGANFQFVNGSPPSGLALGVPVYSTDNGLTWGIYTPSSTGGGAPAGYDARVTNWRIPMTGTMAGGTNFTIRFRVQVK